MSKRSRISGPYIPTPSSRPRGRRVQSLVQIGWEMWICISSIHTYIQTKKHSYLYIRFVIIIFLIFYIGSQTTRCFCPCSADVLFISIYFCPFSIHFNYYLPLLPFSPLIRTTPTSISHPELLLLNFFPPLAQVIVITFRAPLCSFSIPPPSIVHSVLFRGSGQQASSVSDMASSET